LLTMWHQKDPEYDLLAQILKGKRSSRQQIFQTLPSGEPLPEDQIMMLAEGLGGGALAPKDTLQRAKVLNRQPWTLNPKP